MKSNFIDDYPIATQSKVKKQIVWLLIVSICMVFAGLTSAYIVSMGDNFWVKIDLPFAFYISTTLIVVSSIVLVLAGIMLKKGKIALTRIFVIITLVLGVGFGVFQFVGYKALVDSGAHFISSIIVDEGRYGDYFELKKDGKYFTVENNQFYYNGEPLTEEVEHSLQTFAAQLMVKTSEDFKAAKVQFEDYTLLYKSEPLSYVNGALIRPNGEQLKNLDFDRLYHFAQNIKDGRVDFFMRGELGKDFHLLYNGNELQYKERTLMYKGQPLSANLQNKLLRGNSDKSTSYFYIITILHLLHVVGALIALVILTIKTYTIKNENKLAIVLNVNSIFWHFLGVLWIYLLLFLVFIH